MANNKFDFDTATKLSSLLIRTADTMEAENEKMQHNFLALNETWKDRAYGEFQDQFRDADKTVAEAVALLRELNKNMLAYAMKLRDSL